MEPRKTQYIFLPKKETKNNASWHLPRFSARHIPPFIFYLFLGQTTSLSYSAPFLNMLTAIYYDFFSHSFSRSSPPRFLILGRIPILPDLCTDKKPK